MSNAGNSGRVFFLKPAVFFVMAVSVLCLAGSCDVGLGDSVDTQPPEISITYPAQNSIARGNLTVSGTMHDETSIASVTVELFPNDSAAAVAFFAAELHKSENTWTCVVPNEKDANGKYRFADGQYTVRATAKDSASRTTFVERPYYLDNTMPLVVVTRPATHASESADAYGSDVTFSGTLWDAHECSKILLQFYKKNVAGGLDRVAFYEKESIGQNWTIAIPESIFNELKNNMSEPDSAQTYYYTLTAYDNAYAYTGGTPSADDGSALGNASAHYFLNDDIALTLAVDEKFPSREQLSNLDSGLIDTIDGAAGITPQVLESLRIASAAPDAENGSTFSIDPNNKNPTVSISGIEWYPRSSLATALEKNELAGYQTVAITVSKGLSEGTIDPSKVYVYLREPDAGNKTALTEADRIPESSVKQSGDNRIINYVIPESRGSWVLVVDATDSAGFTTTRRETPAYDGVGYGEFAFTINGSAPAFTGNKIQPVTGKVRPGTDGTINVSIHASDDDSPSVTLFAYCGSGSETTPVVITDATKTSVLADNTYSYEWNLTLPAAAEGERITYGFYVSDGKYESSRTEYTYTTDRTPPGLKSLSKPVAADADALASLPDTTAVVSDSSVTIAGTADDDISAMQVCFTGINEEPGSSASWTACSVPGSGGTFSAVLPLSNSLESNEGLYVVWYKMADDSIGADGQLVFGDPQKLCAVLVDKDDPSVTAVVTAGTGSNQHVSETAVSYTTGDFTLSGTVADVNYKELSYSLVQRVPGSGETAGFDETSSTGTITVSGNAAGSAGATWSLASPDTAAAGAGTEFLYTITASDQAGKKVSLVRTVILDNAGPVITVATLSQDNTDKNFFTSADSVIRGTVKSYAGLNGNVQYYDNGEWKDVTITTANSWSLDVNGLTEGPGYEIRFRATDTLGVTGETAAYTIGLDLSEPALEQLQITANGAESVALANWVRNTPVKTDLVVTGEVSDKSGIRTVEYSTVGSTGTYKPVDGFKTVSAAEWSPLSGTDSSGDTMLVADDTTVYFTCTYPHTSGDGTVTLYIRVTDYYNRTTVSNFSFLLDTTPPDLSFINLESGQLISSLESNGTESVFNVRGRWSDNGGSGITGSSAAVYYRTNGGEWQLCGTPESSFSFPLPLAQGLNQTVSFYAVDAVGNSSESAAITCTGINVDTARPTVQITSPAGTAQIFNKAGAEYLLAGTAQDSLSLARVKVVAERDGVRVNADGAADKTGYWFEFTANTDAGTANSARAWEKTLAGSPDNDGSWVFTVTAEDSSGQESVSVTRSVVMDATLPDVVLTDSSVPGVTATENQTFTFSGTANDPASAVSGAASSVSGLASVELGFGNGNGNVTADGAEPAVAGITAAGTDNWSYTVTFADETVHGVFGTEGEKTLFVRATDKAGNVGNWQKKVFVYDTARPKLAVSSSAANGFTKEAFSLKLSASDKYGLAESGAVVVTQTASNIAGDTAVVIRGTGLSETGTATEKTWTLSGLPRAADGSSTEVANGAYTYTVTVTDKSGKTTEDSVHVTIDTAAPETLTIEQPTDGMTGTSAIGGTAYTFRGQASDSGVGMAKIRYAFTQSVPAPDTESDTYTDVPCGNGSWSITKNIDTGTLPDGDNLFEGMWYLHVCAEDLAGNRSAAMTRRFDIDTANPLLALTSFNGKTAPGATETAYLKKGDTLTIQGTASDTGGLASVTVYLNGNAVSAVLSTDGSNTWNAQITAGDGGFNQTATASYTVRISAKDVFGKTTELSRTVLYDVNAPAMEMLTASPLVSVGTDTGTTSYVNGNITIAYRFMDEDSIQSASYTVSNVTPVNVTNPGSSAISWNGTVAVDTTTLPDNTAHTVAFTVTDRAGNVAIYNLELNVNQATDLPVLSFTNVSPAITAYSAENKLANVLGRTTNNKILGTVTDDDGLTSLTMATSTDNGSNWSAESGNLITAAGTTSQSFSAELSLEEGEYQVRFTAKDNNGDAKVQTSTFWIAVDDGAPVFSGVTPANGNFYAVEMPVAGTITDGSGTVILSAAGDGVSALAGEVSAGETAGNSAMQYTGTATGASWTDTVTVRSLDTGTFTKTYTAQDKYGQTATYAVSFAVDKDAPTVTIASPVAAYIRKENLMTIRGSASDTGSSGVASVWYTVQPETDTVPSFTDETGWTAVSGTASWNAAIDLSSNTYPEGAYAVYVAAKDTAGNRSVPVKSAVMYADAADPELNVTSAPAAYIKTGSETKGFTISGTLTETYIDSLTWSRAGTSAANGTITLTGENTAGSSPYSWSLDQTDLDTGSYTYTIIATDKAGRATTWSCSTAFDNDAPTLTVSAPVDNMVISEADLSEGNYTVSGTVIDAGSGLADSGVSCLVTLNGTQLTENTVTLNGGNWSMAITPASEGAMELTVRAADALGNQAEKKVSFYYDKANPVVSITDGTQTLVTNSEFTITGTAYDTNSLAKLEISNGSTVWSSENTIGSDSGLTTYTPATSAPATATETNWSKTFVVGSSNENAAHYLADGTYTLTVTATDISGKTQQTTRVVTVDTGAPTLTDDTITTTAINVSGTDWYGTASLDISVTATDTISGIASVEYAVLQENAAAAADWTAAWNGASWSSMTRSSGTWNAKAIVTDGVNYLRMRATDAAGNTVMTAQKEVHIDTVAPAFENAYGTIEADGTGKDPVETILTNGAQEIVLYIDAKDYDANDDSKYGSGVAGVKAKIGNQNFNEGTIDAEQVSVVSGDSTGDSTAVSTAMWKLTIPADTLKALTGESRVYAQITDAVGNKSTARVCTLQIDNINPTVAFTAPAASTSETIATVNKNITIAGTAGDANGITAVSVELRTGADTWTPIENVSGTNNWSVASFDTANATLFGTNTDTAGTQIQLRAVATDTAGNTSTDTLTLTVDQNSDRPVIKLTNVLTDGTTKLKNITDIYGSISDDDGTVTAFAISQNGTDLTTVTVDNGSWTYAVAGGDGAKTLYFSVTDAAGTAFSTANSDALTKPYVRDSKNNTTDTAVSFSIDTNPPEIITDNVKIDFTKDASGGYFTGTDGTPDDSVAFTNNMVLGGTHKIFALSIPAKDSNGIAAVSVQIGSNTASAATFAGTAEANGNGNWIAILDVSDVADGMQSLSITVKDTSDMTASMSRQVRVDNSAPAIEIQSHAVNDQVTGNVTLKGTTDDDTAGSGIRSVQWIIPEKSVAATVSADTGAWRAVSEGTNSWKIDFTSDAQPASDDTTVVYSQLKYYANDTYAESLGSGIWKVPVYFRIEDVAGNVNVYTEFSLRVDPDGDKPKVTVTYPESGITLGGTIRIFGTAEDNVSVGTVYMQIDTNNNGTFDDADKTTLAAITKQPDSTDTVYDIKDFGASAEETAWWGFAVSGKSSWNQVINSFSEFDPTTGTVNTIRIRVRAVDNNNLAGLWSEPVIINIDKTAPRIGSSVPLKLVQYNDNKNGSGTIVAEQDYVSDIWIKGDWWLTGSIEDESGIASVSLEKANDGDIAITGTLAGNSGWFTEVAKNSSFGSNSGYTFNIPLKTTGYANNNSVVSFKMSATDMGTTAQTSTVTVSLKYDNTAPDIDGQLQHGGVRIGDGADGTVVMQQSNNAYSIESTVTESGSGFYRMAVYFKRTGSNGNTRMYNPVIAKTADGNRIALAGSAENGVVSIIDGLPRLQLDLVTRSAEDTLTHSAIAGNQNVRKGGLVRIAGVERLITDVDYTGGTVTFTPAVSTSFTSAEIAYALIIDNFRVETPTYDADGNISSITNSDGDDIVESIEKNGGLYNWTLAVNSKQIPDGPVEICCVAFDEAGNYSGVTSVSTTVQNNRPAIAKIYLGSDLNGNGVIDADQTDGTGTVIYSERVNVRNETTANATAEVEVDAGSMFTAKALTVVEPEIVGGNGSLYYYLTDSAGNAVSGHSGNLLRDGESGAVSPITLAVVDEKLAGFSDQENELLKFRIFDSTEESTGNDTDMANNTSQWASMAITMNIDVVDEVAPVAVINPFYWNSASDNSLADNSREKGHIELESDLDSSIFNAASGILDTDPKVSGNIVFRGSAYDDQRLTALWMSIDNFAFGSGITTSTEFGFAANGNKSTAATAYYKVAEFNSTSGAWTGKSGTGWTFEITDNSLTQDGHAVQWALTWDSSKITGIAAADVSVRIIAEDKRSTPNASSESASGSDTAGTVQYNNPLYRIDVVPYITKLTTKLSSLKKGNPSVYDRTARGHYPVGASEEITVSGFNLAADNADITQNASGLSSGVFSVTVNGIESLNNKNNNDAKGSYAGTTDSATGDYTVYLNYCNRQPNNDNNNLLTDDVELDVWEFNSRAAVPISGRIADPVMKINPVSGMIGFAFTNGPLYFSMGGTVDNTEYSYIYWQASYDFLSSIAFAYDSAGYSYGSAAGGDINSDAADKFTFMTSKWGCSGLTNRGSYGGTNALRLESIGQKNNGVNDFNKNRIQSPVYATARHGTSTNIYLAYYDDINAEIRFRYGNLTDTAGKRDFGNFQDSEKNEAPREYDISRVSLIAGKETGRNPGEYVSIGVIPGDTAATDVVVAVWYDATAKSLMYSYNTTPANANAAGKDTGTDWKGARALFENAGEYCQLSVDANGGIHIAAYDTANADVLYAYLSSYDDTEADTCTVDSYGIIGTNMTIDTAIVDGKAIPYIGYYALSSVRPKYAYLVDSGSNAPDGAVNDVYTGKWEITLLPTESTVGQDRINVGVWKELATGNLAASTGGTSTWTNDAQGYGSISSGKCYGNGTSNAVLAYAIKESTSGYIETAQMK